MYIHSSHNVSFSYCILLISQHVYRINDLEENVKEQKEEMKRQEEEIIKARKDLETCRIESIKEISKAKASFANSMEEMKKRLQREKMSEHDETIKSMSLELDQLREEKESDRTELEKATRELKKLQDQIVSNETTSTKDSEMFKQQLSTLREQIDHDAKIKDNLESSLGEATSKSESLRTLVKELESHIDLIQQDKNEEFDKIKLKEAQWAKKVEECEEKLELSLSRHSVLLEENERLKKSIEKTSSNVSSDYDELAKRLEKKSNNERILRGEVAQKKQMISILESNEKHLEDHIASLEEQINKLVSDYESRLGSE